MSKGIKKLLQEKFPNLNRLEDISELLVRDINLSESEAEQDGSHNITELPQAYAGRGNMKAQQSAVRLTEIGPRMSLQLIKVEEGLGQGNVLYHSFIYKTEEEIQEALARKEEKLQLKAERRRKQEADVERKQQQKQAHKKKSLEGIKRKKKEAEGGDSDAEDPGMQEDQNVELSDDDVEYYRQEVGEEPDEDLFPTSAKRKREQNQSTKARKRHRPGLTMGAPTETTSKTKHKKTPKHRRQWQEERTPAQQTQASPSQRDFHKKPQSTKRKRSQASGQHKAKRLPGSRPFGSQWKTKSGLGQKQVSKGKGAFRKHLGRKRPA